MNVQLFPADCLQPCGGSDRGSVVGKTDRMASVGEESINAGRQP